MKNTFDNWIFRRLVVIYEIIIVAQSENIKIWNGETMAPHLRLPQQENFFGIQMKFLFIEYLPRNS
jgi:hypothetical protein